MKCVEDKGPDDWTCTAHLAEGRVFRCPFKSMKDARERQYRCEDAEPPRIPFGIFRADEEKKKRRPRK